MNICSHVERKLTQTGMNNLVQRPLYWRRTCEKVKITVIRKAFYFNLMEEYENPIEHAYDVQEGLSLN